MLNDIELQADLNWWKQQKGKTMKKETLQKIIDTSNILAIPMATAAGIWWTSFDVGAYVLGTFALLNSVCEYLKYFCKK